MPPLKGERVGGADHYPPCRHSREGGNPAPIKAGANALPSFLRRQESIRRDSAPWTGRSPVSPNPQAPRHSRESGNLPLMPPVPRKRHRPTPLPPVREAPPPPPPPPPPPATTAPCANAPSLRYDESQPPKPRASRRRPLTPLNDRHSCVGREPNRARQRPRRGYAPSPLITRRRVIPAKAGTYPCPLYAEPPHATTAPCANAPSVRYDGSRPPKPCGATRAERGRGKREGGAPFCPISAPFCPISAPNSPNGALKRTRR